MPKAMPESQLKRKRIAPLRKTVPLDDRRRMGRPTLKTPELVEEICQRIASGRSILSVTNDDDMPEQCVVHRWRSEDAYFKERIELAREDRRETTRCRLIDIGERVINDPHLDPNRVNAAAHAWAKAEAMSGPKQSKLEITGRHGGPVEISDVTDIEMARRIAFIFEKARAQQRLLSANGTTTG